MAATVPQIDFRPLGELGKTYQDARDKAEGRKLLSELGTSWTGGQPPNAVLGAMLGNPNTRDIGLAFVKNKLAPPDAYGFEEVGDRLFRTNKRTGEAAPIGGTGSSRPQSPIGKLKRDFEAGLIDEETYNAAVEHSTTRAPQRPVSVIENIRSKLAAGEPLSAGEQRVYEDARRSDPMDDLIRGATEGQEPGPAVPPAAAAPMTQRPESLRQPQQFRAGPAVPPAMVGIVRQHEANRAGGPPVQAAGPQAGQGSRGSFGDAVSLLRQHASNPEARQFFDQRFGQGAAARALGEAR